VRGHVTELVGPPASGRTSVALAACARAVAAGHAVVYVDADGGLLPLRARNLVAAAVRRDTLECDDDGKHDGGLAVRDDGDCGDGVQLDAMLAQIMRCRVCSWDELAAGVAHALPDIVAKRADVAVVVVDSVALPYRECEGQGAQKRLEAFAGRMAEMAMRSEVAVVLVNNSRLIDAPDRRSAVGGRIVREVGVAAMGEAWAHVCSSRVGLGWDKRGNRVAHLLKSSSMPQTRIRFCITDRGVENEVGSDTDDDSHDDDDEIPTMLLKNAP
jgi:DNA repair protein RadB